MLGTDGELVALAPPPITTFTPRAMARTPMATTASAQAPQAPLGPMVPPTISNPRKNDGWCEEHKRLRHNCWPHGHTCGLPKRLLSKADQAHHDLKPFFQAPIPADQQGLRNPYGTTDAYAGPSPTLDRLSEIEELAKTQHLDLPTIPQLFAANGLSAVSLSSSSSSSDDDDLEAANYAERNLGFVPYVYDPVTVAPLLTRIENEKYYLACGGATKVYVKRRDDGSRGLGCNDKRFRAMKPGEYGPSILEMFVGPLTALQGERSVDEVEHDRHVAAANHTRVLDLATEAGQLAWAKRTPRVQAYLDPAGKPSTIDDWQDEPEPAEGGPQELGLHDTYFGEAQYEPNEKRLSKWSHEIHRIYRWL